MPSYFDKFFPRFSPPPVDSERLRVQAFLNQLKIHLHDRGLEYEAVPDLGRRTGELERFADTWRDHCCYRFGLPADTSWERALHLVFYEIMPASMPGAPRRNPLSMFEHFRC
jgi:hypothetical protein